MQTFWVRNCKSKSFKTALENTHNAEKCHPVEASPGAATFNYFIMCQVLWSWSFQPKGGAPGMSHKTSQGGHEMFNRIKKKTNIG